MVKGLACCRCESGAVTFEAEFPAVKRMSVALKIRFLLVPFGYLELPFFCHG